MNRRQRLRLIAVRRGPPRSEARTRRDSLSSVSGSGRVAREQQRPRRSVVHRPPIGMSRLRARIVPCRDRPDAPAVRPGAAALAASCSPRGQRPPSRIILPVKRTPLRLFATSHVVASRVAGSRPQTTVTVEGCEPAWVWRGTPGPAGARRSTRPETRSRNLPGVGGRIAVSVTAESGTGLTQPS